MKWRRHLPSDEPRKGAVVDWSHAEVGLIAAPALAHRIIRAKVKIAAAHIPYEVPGQTERSARLASVLRVVHLVFNEEQAAATAERIDESIRLARRTDQQEPY